MDEATSSASPLMLKANALVHPNLNMIQQWAKLIDEVKKRKAVHGYVGFTIYSQQSFQSANLIYC